MKKKILAVLAAVVAIVPTMVSAATFTAGDYVNYFKNDADKSAYSAGSTNVGMSTIFVAEDASKVKDGKKYHKVIPSYANAGSICDSATKCLTDSDTFAAAVTHLAGVLESPAAWYASDKLVVEMASKADMVAAFKLTSDAAGTNVVLTDKTKALLSMITGGPIGRNGLRTGDQYVVTGEAKGTNGYYGLKVTKKDGKVTAATVVDNIATTESTVYFMNVVYMNESYTCDEGDLNEAACFECPTGTKDETSYVWKTVGEQDEACKVVETINTKAKCVKSPKTGVDNYLIPAAVVLGVCAIVLTVLKRKDAFKAI